MGFPRKKKVEETPETTVTQENVGYLAAEALKKLRNVRVRIPLTFIFTQPVLMQQWSDKAVRQVLGDYTGHKQPQQPKNLTAEYESSWYRNLKDQAVVPLRVLRAAIIEGAISTGKMVTKADLKRSMRVLGLTAPLVYDRVDEYTETMVEKGRHMQIDLVRVGNNKPDFRARAAFPAGTTFQAIIEFGSPLTPDMIMAAVECAGSCIGLCEWRPDRGGSYGTFIVETMPTDEKTIDNILKRSEIPEKRFVIPPEMLKPFMAISKQDLPAGPLRKIRALVDHDEQVQQSRKGRRVNGEATQT